MTKDELCYSLGRFVTDVKKQNGEDNPGSTLHELIISLQLALDVDYCKVFKFLDDDDLVQPRNTSQYGFMYDVH